MKIRKPLYMLGLTLLLMSPLVEAQVPVNISYPINGGTYTNYFTSKFDVNCPGGAFTAKWGFDGVTVGGGDFYDHISGQFGYKLPPGPHVFWVSTSCGVDRVQFQVL